MCLKILIGLFAFLISSCDFTPTVEARVQNYQQSLSRYEGLPLVFSQQRFPEFHLPTRKNREQALSEFDVSLIEFMSLQACDVGYLVGEKNSVLGKVMQNSQRLLYETNIIRAVEQCFIDSSTLEKKLRTIVATKRSELDKAFSNAIWGADEAQQFFSFSNGHLPMSFTALNIQELDIALSQLNEIGASLQQLPDLNTGRMEDNLQAMYHSEYAGQLILTLILLTDSLATVSQTLDTLNPDETFCQGPMTFLKQQFNTHYINGLQPYMAKVNSTAYIILTHIMSLHGHSGRLSEKMEMFLLQFSLTSKEGLWSKYQQASRAHAQSWNRLLRQCGVF